jgi:hypothetical protein
MPGPDFSIVFPPDPVWVRAIREAVRTLLAAAGRAELTDTALLLTSEAVTNAVNACRNTGCSLPLTVFGEYTGTLRLFVHDEAPGAPAVRAAAHDEETGRGLAILTGCATDWGVCHQGPAPGKAIWFELGG